MMSFQSRKRECLSILPGRMESLGEVPDKEAQLAFSFLPCNRDDTCFGRSSCIEACITSLIQRRLLLKAVVSIDDQYVTQRPIFKDR